MARKQRHTPEQIIGKLREKEDARLKRLPGLFVRRGVPGPIRSV